MLTVPGYVFMCLDGLEPFRPAFAHLSNFVYSRDDMLTLNMHIVAQCTNNQSLLKVLRLTYRSPLFRKPRREPYWVIAVYNSIAKWLTSQVNIFNVGDVTTLNVTGNALHYGYYRTHILRGGQLHEIP